MAHVQVITVTPEGLLEGLQRKPGQGLDLRQFGPCRITRASEILWYEEHQKWTVRVLQGEYAKCFLTTDVVEEVGLALETLPGAPQATEDGLLVFEDYDEAVKTEIAFLDHLRRLGRE